MGNGKIQRIAIMDIGSNTVRLVVYEVTPYKNFTQLQNVKLPVRLYQYLDEEQKLSKKGLEKLEEVILLFQKILGKFKIDKVIATATAVIRQAKNQEDILAHIHQKTGVLLQLLSGEQEAYYGQYAVACTTEFSEGYTVDMGGGSTEVTYFKKNKIVHSHSFPFGVVTLKNLFFAESKGIDDEAVKKAEKFIRKQFDALEWLEPRGLPLIAIGGSSRNIASVYQVQNDYPISGMHEFEMSDSELADTGKLFKKMTYEELQNLDGLSRDRADIIFPANLTFLTLYQKLDAEKFVLCNKGLREGLLIEEINRESPNSYDPDEVIEGVIQRLTESYNINTKASNKRMEVALALLEAIEEEGIFEKQEQFIQYLKYAAILYHVGSYIEEDDSSRHSFYLIANSNLDGFSHKDRVILALLASYKNKTLFNQYLDRFHNWFGEDELRLIRYAGCLIKFSEALNITRVNQIEKLKLERIDKKSYCLKIDWSFDPIAERYRADRQKKNLETIIKHKIVIDFNETN